MKATLKVLALGAAVAASATIAKADTLFYTVIVTNATTCTAGCVIGSGSNTTGLAAPTYSGDGFQVNFNVSAPPAVPAPGFSTNSFNLEDNTAVASTVTIKVSDTGLTSAPTLTLNTFTSNSLTAPTFVGDTITNYYDTTDATYGTGNTLATVSYTGSASFSSGPMAAALSSATPYSETTIYTLHFGAGDGTLQSMSASSEIVAATPEPSSLALLGTTLLGAAGLARRRFFGK